MDNFVKTTIVKEGTYQNRNKEGRKLTNRSVLLREIKMKNRMMNAPSEYKKALNKGVTTMEVFL